jgi:CheY-like chemotaxis protein
VSRSDRLRDLIEETVRFGIGEHHRGEYLDSAPAVILGAAAARTQRIRLTSAVTALSSADPVRFLAGDAAHRVTPPGGHRQGLARLLVEAGFEVSGTAQDAAGLVRLVDVRRPDVAVTDIKMPPSHTDEGSSPLGRSAAVLDRDACFLRRMRASGALPFGRPLLVRPSVPCASSGTPPSRRTQQAGTRGTARYWL